MNTILKRLLQLISTKEEKFSEIMHKTYQQRDSIFNDNIEELMQISDAKQMLMDEVDQIDTEYESLYKQVRGNEQREDLAEYFININQKKDDILVNIRKISELETENKLQLNNKMNEARNIIRQITVGKKGFNAYFHTGIQSSNYIDEKN